MKIQKIRDSRFSKALAFLLMFELMSDFFHLNTVHALTGGPSQPEVESFTPIGTTEMVDVFSGDFNYNIPLLDVGGYPVNISYNSGITADQEASWVGLGWNLNVGNIQRNMRSLPDDFSADEIQSEFNMRPNRTFGVSLGFQPETFGAEYEGPFSLSASIGARYNNYNGIGFETSVSPTVSLSKTQESQLTTRLGVGLSASDNGLSVSPSVSLSLKSKKKTQDDKGPLTGGLNIGSSFNSRQGLTSVNAGLSISQAQQTSKKAKMKDEKRNISRLVGGSYMASSSIGSSVSFASTTYTPQISMNRSNYAVTLKFAADLSFFGLDASFPITGYYSEDKLAEKSKSVPAFGYLYMQNSNEYDEYKKVALDFNREKDQAFTENMPNLPLTNFTYDQFQVTGQGVSGQYRPFRSDIGYVYDPFAQTTSTSGSGGVELGAGNAVDVGIDVDIASSQSYSGNWTIDNFARPNLRFKGENTGDPYFEPAYFRQVGEISVEDDNTIYNTTGGRKPVEIDISKPARFTHRAESRFKDIAGNTYSISANNSRRQTRAKRNQAMTFLTREEVSVAGLSRYVSPYGKAHHIGEITIVRPDGARYYYGIPAYNLVQKDATFNVSGNNYDLQSGLVEYSPGQDNTTSNSKGDDHYYQKDIIPAFAHSYLLTSVVSADYVDVDGIVGPSDGDLGTYTKFNYDANSSQPGVQPTVSNYKWRMPYADNKASFNEGFKGDAADNKGSYTYGEKELWYLHTIETKTYVAVFETSQRHDARGVNDENGGMGGNSAHMYKLDKIKLYSKSDYSDLLNGQNVQPVKTVHFEYDYSLSPNIENNDGGSEMLNGTDINNAKGKLTLRRIYFTYEGSNLGKLSPYKFMYGDRNHDGTEDSAMNPQYNLKGYDRWGNYRQNCDQGGACPYTMYAPEYPYVQQDKNLQDQNTAMWTLTDILLPSGGKISVDFESDDYAYVQDRPAMEMFVVDGVGLTSDYVNDNTLWENGSGPDTDNERDYVYFKLPSGWTGNSSDLNADFLSWINSQAGRKLYFKFKMRVNDDSIWEYVPGYANILDAGVCSNNQSYGYIHVEKVSRDRNDNGNPNKDVNPFTMAGWNFVRNYMPRVANGYDDSQLEGGGFQNMANALLNSNLLVSIVNAFKGPNGELRSKGYSSKIECDHSWIRLQSPFKKKLGGGNRVASVKIWDQWSAMTGSNENSADYGQEYKYTMVENGREISSGVASYEPLIGGDENPFRQPLSFSEKAFLGPKNENYVETPFGESFFPGASVGYRKVTVTDLKRNDGSNTFTRHATGKAVHEFYTAKDYPVIVQFTDVKPLRDKTSALSQLFGAGVRDFMTASQGYSIELNDMHGKPKATWVYAEEKDTPISGTEYLYNETEETVSVPAIDDNLNVATAAVRRLDNTVSTINVDGSVEQKQVGVEIDVINDFREHENYTVSAGLHGNVTSFLVPPVIPFVLPGIFPSFSSSENKFRSVVTTKVINRFGIVREVKSYDLGAWVSKENLAYDAETGEVLLQRTKNEFEDAIYDFHFPAHWAYQGMGQAYKNIGLRINMSVPGSGIFNSNDLVPGDELVTSSGVHIWVYQPDPASSNKYFIDRNGGLVTGSIEAKVVRSGRRNQQQVQIGTITCMTNPIVNGQLTFNQSSKVIQSAAVEYDEEWQLLCGALGSNSINGYVLSNDMQAFLAGNLASGNVYYFDFTPTGETQSYPVTGEDYDNPLYQPITPYSWPGDPATTIYVVGGILTATTKFSEIFHYDPDLDKCYELEATVNPYITGLLGNFRSKRSWTYLNERNYQSIGVDQQKDGIFSNFNSFWEYGQDKWIKTTTDPSWTFVSEITAFSPFGIDLESRDALNRYSAEILGYNNTFVKAVGMNADYNELAFDGFEDYDYEQVTDCCPGHFNFYAYRNQLSGLESHSGRYSISVASENNISGLFPLTSSAINELNKTVPFTIRQQDLLGRFGPKTYNGTKKYVLSYWVKKQNTLNVKVFDYPAFTAIITNGSSSLINTVNRGKIIDGWQRCEVVFTIPANASGNLTIQFDNNDNSLYYLDDIRIHPFNGTMKSYVIDPVSFRLWAELDERNFATFYEYDEEGKLLRIKKETERGIYTIQESRKGTSKINY